MPRQISQDTVIIEFKSTKYGMGITALCNLLLKLNTKVVLLFDIVGVIWESSKCTFQIISESSL